MGLYAYCVVPPDHPPPRGTSGIGGSPVEMLTAGGLAVWASAGDRPQVSAEAVQDHNRVVELAVTQEVTPVPLRFGQWAEDAGHLDRLIAVHADRYREWLERFAGCLEFGLRILDPAAGEAAQDVRAPVTTGREYMQGLRETSRLAEAQRARAEQIERGIHDVLRDIVRDERIEALQTRHAVVTMSHLVAREHFDEYRERARQLRSTYPDLRFLVSGPWAPYSFAQ